MVIAYELRDGDDDEAVVSAMIVVMTDVVELSDASDADEGSSVDGRYDELSKVVPKTFLRVVKKVSKTFVMV